MGRKKKDALIQFNKKNILDTARQLFAEKGISQTTMDDIAKEADYSKSTIYVYFKSKEEIYNHIIYENMVLLKDAMKESIESSKSDYEQCYYSICKTLVTFQEKYPLYFESILGEISVKPEDFEKQPVLLDIYNVGEEMNALILNYLKDGKEKKYIRNEIDPVQATFTLWASICGVISLAEKKKIYFEKDMKWSKTEFLDKSFAMLLKSITL